MPRFVTKTSNIFISDCEVYVNPVNIRGVAGAGLAREFRERFPESHKEYLAKCNGPVLGPVKIGFVLISPSEVNKPKWIFYFPTKDHWEDPSSISYISEGLDDMSYKLLHGPVKSVAIPALGCGLGGLSWNMVEPLIKEKLAVLPEDFLVELYPPK